MGCQTLLFKLERGREEELEKEGRREGGRDGTNKYTFISRWLKLSKYSNLSTVIPCLMITQKQETLQKQLG